MCQWCPIAVDSPKFIKDLKKHAEALKQFQKSLPKVMKREKKQKSGLTPIARTTLTKEVVIVAANGVDAKVWAREQGLRGGQWKYAALPDLLMHVKDNDNAEIVFVPGWEHRPDHKALSDAVVGGVAKVIAA